MYSDLSGAGKVLLNKIFKRYMPKEERPADMEMRPLFADEEEGRPNADNPS